MGEHDPRRHIETSGYPRHTKSHKRPSTEVKQRTGSKILQRDSDGIKEYLKTLEAPVVRHEAIAEKNECQYVGRRLLIVGSFRLKRVVP